MQTLMAYNYIFKQYKDLLIYSIIEMNFRNRAGNRWTINEVLSLQREFELLGWNIDQIAEKHQRTPEGIMNKLDREGFADYNVLYSNYYNLNDKMHISNNTKCDTIVLDAVDSEDDEECDDAGDEDYVENADEEDNDDDDDNEDEDDPLTRRVANLETNLDEIKSMLKSLTIQKQLGRL